MHVDHIFIFSKNKGKEADDLLRLGFVEGSNRIHEGQGTRNRVFYFENFFLEVLWVSDEQEIRQKHVSDTLLSERANFYKNKYSRFGLCFLNSSDTDVLFENAQKYQPSYFPPEMTIDVITNEQSPCLPWTFRLPFKEKKDRSEEPMDHKPGMQKLNQINFGVNSICENKKYVSFFDNNDLINFKQKEANNLELVFDNNRAGDTLYVESLNLKIRF